MILRSQVSIRAHHRICSRALEYLVVDDEEESTFRQVHVISHQGDLLKTLVKIGQRCRELVIEFSTHWSSETDHDISSFGFAFKGVVNEFNELVATGITPFLELSRRSGSPIRKRVLEVWIQKTAWILATALFQYNGC